ncbi:DUF1569 domain-containing protein [Flavobacterium johnsoniae]|uniref:DUF1569 domain-containing protein n=1 Tax=Flavobacterium johnsoniae (strain ATCC 17061 / DSM 2064 / JCM 8514 / BCRC 14874 / CCUG 350202 / NBRC 14942 / NCIMB 11054 / UW101) TaxID=376686 RepID=A5FGA6_FLAJ1|nr:hypothetical protein Fjoh_2738 [Flavobacterium johnsoniae UW101]SHK55228.1 Protein of unknown function [Flavobacterium johnsoniae]
MVIPAMQNVFHKQDCDQFISRINQLKIDSQPLWGKMSVDQMLAHCNVTYEMVYDNIHSKPNLLMRLLLKLLAKKQVVSEKPYPRNLGTAPQFIIKGDCNFELEKNRLISYILKTQELGENEFDGKESLSFGKLTSKEWNNMFAKHLDHHLSQFGV